MIDLQSFLAIALVLIVTIGYIHRRRPKGFPPGMETIMMTECEELIENLAKTVGTPISTSNRFNAAIINGLWSIVASKRYDQNDPLLGEFMEQVNRILGDPGTLNVLARFFPSIFYLRKFFPNVFPNPNKEFQKKIYTFFDEIIKEHKSTIQPGCPRDFIDVYLEHMNETNDPASSFYKEEGEHSIFVTLLDLFVAGAETTSSTLVWSFLCLAMFPDKQDKLIKEISTVVGDSRSVSLTDKPNLLYLEATCLEVLRYSALASLGVPHRAMADVKFHGYLIPKDTIVLPNLYAASRDISAWGDPETFKPERFLSSDGKSIVHNDAFAPFSLGKRLCPGKALAEDELFLFLGNLVQRFHISLTGDFKFETQSSGTRMPKPHKLILTDRFAT